MRVCMNCSCWRGCVVHMTWIAPAVSFGIIPFLGVRHMCLLMTHKTRIEVSCRRCLTFSWLRLIALEALHFFKPLTAPLQITSSWNRKLTARHIHICDKCTFNVLTYPKSCDYRKSPSILLMPHSSFNLELANNCMATDCSCTAKLAVEYDSWTEEVLTGAL